MTARVEVTGYTELMRGLKQLEPATRKEIRAEFTQIGNKVAYAAKANASWSSRIPTSIATSVTTKGVAVVARKRVAPHSGVYERGQGRGSSFRHPVFGNRDVWVTEPTRPYLQPAADATTPLVVPLMDAAMRRAILKAGL